MTLRCAGVHILWVEFEDDNDEDRATPPDDSIATRCRIAREHGKLTRWMVNGAAGLSRGHYGRIEDWFIRKVSSDTCRQLIVGFARLGVKVSFEWLLMGTGKPPTRLRVKVKWNAKAFLAQQAQQSKHYQSLRQQRLKKPKKKTNG